MKLLMRPWRHYFDFRGRSRRLECLLFWGTFYGGLIVLAIGGTIITALLQGDSAPSTGGNVEPTVAGILIFLAASVIPAASLSVRRLHDLGISGWWLMIWLVPVLGQMLGWVLSFIIIFIPSPGGENQYGHDPRDPMESGDTEALDRIFA
jgi:uncharacterized membrane protein YhaH (DUF805 family)